MEKLITRRHFLRLSVGVASAALIAACQPGRSTEATETTAPVATDKGAAEPAAKDAIVLRMHGRVGGQGDHFSRFIEKFNQDNGPEVTAVAEHFPGADYFAKINTMLAGGTVGDVMWISANEGFFRMAATGSFTPLDDIVEAQGYDLCQHEDCAEMGKVGGKLFTIPWNTQPGRTGLYYNKKMLDDAGVPYPTDEWTYDDMLDAAKEMSHPEDRIFGMNILTNYYGGQVNVRSFGGDFIDRAGEKCLVTEPNVVTCLEFMGDMMLKHKVTPLADQIEVGTQQMFAANKLAMFQDGFWGRGVTNYVEDQDVVGYARMPLGPGGPVRGSTYEFCAIPVTRASKHPNEAFKLMTYFGTKEAGDDLAFVAKSVPGGRPDVYDDPKNLADPHFAGFAAAMREVGPLLLPWNFRESEYAKVMTETLALYFIGEAGLEETVQKAYKDGQAILDKDSLAGGDLRFEPYVPVWMRS